MHSAHGAVVVGRRGDRQAVGAGRKRGGVERGGHGCRRSLPCEPDGEGIYLVGDKPRQVGQAHPDVADEGVDRLYPAGDRSPGSLDEGERRRSAPEAKARGSHSGNVDEEAGGRAEVDIRVGRRRLEEQLVEAGTHVWRNIDCEPRGGGAAGGCDDGIPRDAALDSTCRRAPHEHRAAEGALRREGAGDLAPLATRDLCMSSGWAGGAREVIQGGAGVLPGEGKVVGARGGAAAADHLEDVFTGRGVIPQEVERDASGTIGRGGDRGGGEVTSYRRRHLCAAQLDAFGETTERGHHANVLAGLSRSSRKLSRRACH